MYVPHNALCAFGPIGPTVIAFSVLVGTASPPKRQRSGSRSAAGNIFPSVKRLNPLRSSQPHFTHIASLNPATAFYLPSVVFVLHLAIAIF